MNLDKIFDSVDCDRGSKKHFYGEIYSQYWDKAKPTKLMEIGIFKGAGLKAYDQYFDQVELLGLDTFQRVPPEDLDVLERDNVDWIKADSTDQTKAQEVISRYYKHFDFIVDDGLHFPEANMLTFQNYWSALKSGGWYFIEDVWPLYSSPMDHPWIKKHSDKFQPSLYDAFIRKIEATAAEVVHHDNRKKSGHGDSYIIALRKD